MNENKSKDEIIYDLSMELLKWQGWHTELKKKYVELLKDNNGLKTDYKKMYNQLDLVEGALRSHQNKGLI